MKRLAGLVRTYETRVPRWFRILAAVVWAAAIWFASSQSSVPVPAGPGLPWLGNLGHVFVFGVLAALVYLSCPGRSGPRAGVALACTLVYALVDEWHQSFVPKRHADPWDVCSDLCGGLLAVWILWRLLDEEPPPAWWAWCIAALTSGSVAMASR